MTTSTGVCGALTPESFAACCCVERRGDTLSVRCALRDLTTGRVRQFERSVDLGPLTQAIAQRMAEWHNQQHLDAGGDPETVAGMFDFLGDAVNAAEHAATSVAQSQLFQQVAPLALNLAMPGTGTMLAKITQVHGAVAAARDGNPKAQDVLTQVQARAQAGDPAAQQTLAQVQAIAQALDQKQAKADAGVHTGATHSHRVHRGKNFKPTLKVQAKPGQGDPGQYAQQGNPYTDPSSPYNPQSPNFNPNLPPPGYGPPPYGQYGQGQQGQGDQGGGGGGGGDGGDRAYDMMQQQNQLMMAMVQAQQGGGGQGPSPGYAPDGTYDPYGLSDNPGDDAVSGCDGYDGPDGYDWFANIQNGLSDPYQAYRPYTVGGIPGVHHPFRGGPGKLSQLYARGVTLH